MECSLQQIRNLVTEPMGIIQLIFFKTLYALQSSLNLSQHHFYYPTEPQYRQLAQQLPAIPHMPSKATAAPVTVKTQLIHSSA